MDTVANEVRQLEAEFLPVETDVTDEDQVRSLMDQVYRKWGRKTAAEEAARFLENHPDVTNPPSKPKPPIRRRRKLDPNLQVDDCSTATTYTEGW